MPNPFSDIIKDVKGAFDVPTPPGFEPIADILLPDSYKSVLTRIIKSSPPDFMKNRGWWESVKEATGATFQDMKDVFLDAKKADQQPKINVFKVLGNFIKLPIIQQDPTTQRMIRSYANGAKNHTADVDSLLKMQKMLSQRLERLQAKLAKKETTAERFRRSTNKPKQTQKAQDTANAAESLESTGELISEECIIEGMLSDVVSKMTAYFSNPNLAAVISDKKKDEKRSQNLAKAVVYSLLLRVNDNAYKELTKHGIDQKTLMTVFKNRKQRGNNDIFNKAKEIVLSSRGIAPKAATVATAKAATVATAKAPTAKAPVSPAKDPRTATTATFKPPVVRGKSSKTVPGSSGMTKEIPTMRGQRSFHDISTRGPTALPEPSVDDIHWWNDNKELQKLLDDSHAKKAGVQQIEEEPDSINLDTPNQNEVNAGSMTQNSTAQDHGAPIKQRPDIIGQDKEDKEPTVGAKIYQRIMSIARAANAAGQDPVQMADYALQRYEDEGVPEAAIVRRMFERSRVNRAKRESKFNSEGSGDPLQ